MKEFVAPRPKLYSYLTNKKIKSEDFKKRLENNRILLRLEQKFRSELQKGFLLNPSVPRRGQQDFP